MRWIIGIGLVGIVLAAVGLMLRSGDRASAPLVAETRRELQEAVVAEAPEVPAQKPSLPPGGGEALAQLERLQAARKAGPRSIAIAAPERRPT